MGRLTATVSRLAAAIGHLGLGHGEQHGGGGYVWLCVVRCSAEME